MSQLIVWREETPPSDVWREETRPSDVWREVLQLNGTSDREALEVSIRRNFDSDQHIPEDTPLDVLWRLAFTGASLNADPESEVPEEFREYEMLNKRILECLALIGKTSKFGAPPDMGLLNVHDHTTAWAIARKISLYGVTPIVFCWSVNAAIELGSALRSDDGSIWGVLKVSSECLQMIVWMAFTCGSLYVGTSASTLPKKTQMSKETAIAKLEEIKKKYTKPPPEQFKLLSMYKNMLGVEIYTSSLEPHNIMWNPVQIGDEYTYECEDILKWLKENTNGTSPKQPLGWNAFAVVEAKDTRKNCKKLLTELCTEYAKVSTFVGTHIEPEGDIPSDQKVWIEYEHAGKDKDKLETFIKKYMRELGWGKDVLYLNAERGLQFYAYQVACDFGVPPEEMEDPEFERCMNMINSDEFWAFVKMVFNIQDEVYVGVKKTEKKEPDKKWNSRIRYVMKHVGITPAYVFSKCISNALYACSHGVEKREDHLQRAENIIHAVNEFLRTGQDNQSVQVLKCGVFAAASVYLMFSQSSTPAATAAAAPAAKALPAPAAAPAPAAPPVVSIDQKREQAIAVLQEISNNSKNTFTEDVKQYLISKNGDIDEIYRCHLNPKGIMWNPVTIGDGYTYECENILKYLTDKSNGYSPMNIHWKENKSLVSYHVRVNESAKISCRKKIKDILTVRGTIVMRQVKGNKVK